MNFRGMGFKPIDSLFCQTIRKKHPGYMDACYKARMVHETGYARNYTFEMQCVDNPHLRICDDCQYWEYLRKEYDYSHCHHQILKELTYARKRMYEKIRSK